jgi:hypothetical protein
VGEALGRHRVVVKELADRPEYCLDLTYELEQHGEIEIYIRIYTSNVFIVVGPQGRCAAPA